ncbi:MAG TPA: hypothetical protein VK540_15370 [Polyangiaceae bacterium]|nr:hypothetical protein [Polyangiaceae bacterium]
MMRSGGGPALRAAASAIARRRFWVTALLAAGALLLSALVAFAQERPRLVVYLHTEVKSRALEALLAQRMPGTEVIVCGRYRDFTRELARTPDAALALEPVLQANALTGALKGLRGGRDTEPYVLLSIGATIDAARFSTIVLGAVDLLGRDGTTQFVANLLGLEASPEIKFVIKSEDLLPLLQFQSADAVLLPEREVVRTKNLSKLDLQVTPLATRVGLPAVAFGTEVGRRVFRPLVLALDSETNGKLGVDTWR